MNTQQGLSCLGVVVNERKAQVGSHMRRLGARCRMLGLRLMGAPAAVRMAGYGEGVDDATLALEVDGMLALGGDGTLLRAARMLNGRQCPLMGLNLGSLGYLTSLPEDQLDKALDSLHQGDYRISRRAKLAGHLFRKSRKVDLPDALNDIVVSRGASGRVVGLEVAVDGYPVTTYVCDGVIISTPTGSTAYGMAAGGPIIMPETSALGLSVICPHTLSSRPLVLPDTVTLTLSVRWGVAPLLLSIDGQDDHALQAGDRIELRRSTQTVCLAVLPDHNAFNVLSRKLGWGVDVNRKIAQETNHAVSER